MSCVDFRVDTKEYEYLHDPRFIEYYAMPKIKEIIGSDKKILDVGTRSGFWLAYFCHENNNTGIGIDLGPVNVEYPHIDMSGESVDVTFRLPFKDKEFDVSTMIATLEHLWVPGDRYAIENLIRVTKEKIILMTPIYVDRINDCDRGKGNVEDHINMFSCERFDAFLESFGFEYQHIDVPQGYSSHIGIINLTERQ